MLVPIDLEENTKITGKTKIDGLYEGIKTNKIVGDRKVLVKVDCYIEERDEREACNLVKLEKYPNVVTYKHSGFFENNQIHNGEICIYAVMRHYEDKTLNDVDFSTLSEENVKDILTQLTEGLGDIHKEKIIHRDLRPENVFYEEDNGKITVVIYGFGLSKEILHAPLQNSSYPNKKTTDYSSPEMQPDSKLNVTESTDVFSLGGIFYFILSKGKHAFGDKADSRSHNIMKNRPNLTKLKCSEAEIAENLIQRMINNKAVNRPALEEVKNHPFFWSNTDRLNFCTMLYRATEEWNFKRGLKGDLNLINPMTGAKRRDYKMNDSKNNWCERLQLSTNECQLYDIPKNQAGCIKNLLNQSEVKYNGNSTYSLLCFIRHRKSHSDDEFVKKISLNDKYLWDFFKGRFPKFLSILTVTVRESKDKGLAELKYFY
uniref:serine/threonine-protein kinase/endoribonuclease IRE1-like n=1 Tax=Styela clava TaxID=7725 RepID=UPI00193A932B|nr:serine/threonine-protein kinase/endoribonuclease IRE1-like [Styela clava]